MTTGQAASDELGAVAAAAKAGDESAFTALVERYRRELQLHCYRMLGSVEDSEDLTQETFLRARGARGGACGGTCLSGPGCTGSPRTPAST